MAHRVAWLLCLGFVVAACATATLEEPCVPLVITIDDDARVRPDLVEVRTVEAGNDSGEMIRVNLNDPSLANGGLVGETADGPCPKAVVLRKSAVDVQGADNPLPVPDDADLPWEWVIGLVLLAAVAMASRALLRRRHVPPKWDPH